MGRASRYAPEVRERAVRMVAEHQGEYASQWAAMASIAAKIGCTPETLRKWVRQTERDMGQRGGLGGGSLLLDQSPVWWVLFTLSKSVVPQKHCVSGSGKQSVIWANVGA